MLLLLFFVRFEYLRDMTTLPTIRSRRHFSHDTIKCCCCVFFLFCFEYLRDMTTLPTIRSRRHISLTTQQSVVVVVVLFVLNIYVI